MTDMRVEATAAGTEMKWCLFAKDVRGSVGKIVVDTRDDGGGAAKVVAVFVRPEFRGRRLGELLVRRAERALYDNGFDAVELDAEEKVDHHGRLVGLYEECGFRVCDDWRVTYEYNDEEAYRKVHMRCDLRAMFEGGVSASQPASGDEPRAAPWSGLALSFEFVSRLRREAIELIVTAPLHLDVRAALARVERAHPAARDSALRAGVWIRRQGHPDWLELAGYLRHVGRAQELWTKWQTPFAVRVFADEAAARRSRHRMRRFRRRESPAQGGGDGDDEEEEQDRRTGAGAGAGAGSGDEGDDGERPMDDAKVGPLPDFCRDPAESRVVDVERYGLGAGLDEALLTWGPLEFAFLALSRSPASSAPRELAQVLRYAALHDWLDDDPTAALHATADPARAEHRRSVVALESWDDAEVKEWAAEFRRLVREVDAASASSSSSSAPPPEPAQARDPPHLHAVPPLTLVEEADAARRREQLIAKYLSGVVVI